jgi:hypothetical protein
MVKQRTTLTFYGGVDEIGGNKILLQDGDANVLLDFGISFGLKKRFYSRLFFRQRTKRVCRNSESCRNFRAPTDLTGNLLKLTLSLFPIVT